MAESLPLCHLHSHGGSEQRSLRSLQREWTRSAHRASVSPESGGSSRARLRRNANLSVLEELKETEAPGMLRARSRWHKWKVELWVGQILRATQAMGRALKFILSRWEASETFFSACSEETYVEAQGGKRCEGDLDLAVTEERRRKWDTRPCQALCWARSHGLSSPVSSVLRGRSFSRDTNYYADLANKKFPRSGLHWVSAHSVSRSTEGKF